MKITRSEPSADPSADTALKGVMLVPGAEVPLVALDLPAGVKGIAREQVALRQLRDQVGLSGDQIEIRPFSTRGEGETWRRVLIAETGAVAAWRNQAQPDCVAVLPDYLAVPAAPDLWVLSQGAGTLQARLGLEDGFSAEPELVAALLEAALNEGQADRPRAVYCSDPLPPDVVSLLDAWDVPVVTHPDALKDFGVSVPRVLAHGELEADLRTDPRAARARLRKQLLPWRWPILFGVIAAGLWAAAQILEIQRLEAAAQMQREAAMRLVRAHFVPSGPVLDIRQQVTRTLLAQQAAVADWRGDVAPLTLIGQAADVIAAERARPEVLNYDSASGLTVAVRVADFAAVDRLAGALRAAGLDVDVTEAEASGGNTGVRADLRITAETGEP